MTRRELLKTGSLIGAGSILAPTFSALSAEPQADLITRAIPATGERLPVIGLGTNNYSVTSPEDLAARREVLQNMPKRILMRAGFDYVAIRMRQWFKKIPDDNFENWVLKRFGRTLRYALTVEAMAQAARERETALCSPGKRLPESERWDRARQELAAVRQQAYAKLQAFVTCTPYGVP